LANKAEVAVVREKERDAAKPALMLGNTQFAQKNGLDVTKLRDWSFVHRVVGKDVIIAGHDHPSKAPTDNARRPNWDRVGTAKAAVDFARQFMGVRFLYPDLPGYTPVSGAAKIDLLALPAIEFLPMATMTVPESLNVTTTPLLRVNTAHPAGASFYDLAHNRFPRVDEQFGGHTWERAVPAELFAEHPEYFALISGSRLKPEGGRAQYCLSNADVQERIYRDLAGFFDKGYDSVDLGQPDGFRECQCEKCDALHGTGKGWSEKIWIFHRDVARRLEKSHPGRQVTMMSYILTAAPPKSFKPPRQRRPHPERRLDQRNPRRCESQPLACASRDSLHLFRHRATQQRHHLESQLRSQPRSAPRSHRLRDLVVLAHQHEHE